MNRRKALRKLAALGTVLFLGACGLTPQGDFIRGVVKTGGAQAADKGLSSAEWYICQAASVGAVRRRYGGSSAYREICEEAGGRLFAPFREQSRPTALSPPRPPR